MGLDLIDRRILGFLQRDARTAVTDLGRAVDRSATATRKRIERLESAGVIRGYRAVIDPASVGFPVEAVVAVEGDPGGLRGLARRLAAEEPTLTAASLVTGGHPLRVVLRARSGDHLSEILERSVPEEEVDRYEADVVLESLVRAPRLPVEPEANPEGEAAPVRAAP